MKFKNIITIVAAVITLSSCLTFRAIEQRITFDEKFGKGSVVVTFEDIGSRKISFALFNQEKLKMTSEADIDTLKQKDFAELLEMYEGDNLLLDEAGRGVYVKERKLFEKNNRLHASYKGIFRNYAVDKGEELKVLQDIITITFKLDDDIEDVKTNGKLEEKENLITITWPKTEKEIYWKLIYSQDENSDSPVYSLIDNYRSWKKENGSR